jgi:hypothetical protein
MGYDKETKITKIKPRFLEYNRKMDDFYRKRLIIEYATHHKTAMSKTKLHFWHLPKASDETINVYEAKKLSFTNELNRKLLDKIELSNKTAESKNKSEELVKVKELYDQFGNDVIKICDLFNRLCSARCCGGQRDW